MDIRIRTYIQVAEDDEEDYVERSYEEWLKETHDANYGGNR